METGWGEGDIGFFDLTFCEFTGDNRSETSLLSLPTMNLLERFFQSLSIEKPQ